MAADLQVAIESLLAETREQTAWLRLIGLQALEPALRTTLRTPKQRLVYQLSDGRGVREIANQANVGVGTVSRLWSDWAALGLVRESSKWKGRWEHLIPLTSVPVDADHSR